MEDVRAILNDFMNGVNDISKEEGMTGTGIYEPAERRF